jgi:hypothetical protein
MRNGIFAITIAGMVLLSDHVWPQQPEQSVLGFGPETFDWKAGWLGSSFDFLFSIPVLAVVFGCVAVGLVRQISSSWHRIAPLGRKRSLPGGV